LDSTHTTGKGISEKNRRMLSILHREMAGPFTPHDAVALLSLDINRAHRFLAYLVDRGWLARIRRGLYITVPLDAVDPAHWPEDPWVVASKVFSPCYIGGWSACEHWNLTEQIFRETIVVSGRRVRHRQIEIHEFPFRVKVVASHKIFGTSVVWRGQTRVLVSDPARTIVDILDDPSIGGGIRHVAEILGTYLADDRRDDSQLLDYAHKLGNRTVFKRLGYVLETLDVVAPTLVDACLNAMSSGIVLLDPAAPSKGRILRRWNLRINVTVGPRRTL